MFRLQQRPSCPGLTRASTFFGLLRQAVDGRDEPGHDAVGTIATPTSEGAHLHPAAGAGLPLNRGELPPNALNPSAIRATLRDPDGFGHIGSMTRPSGVFGAVALFGCRASSNSEFSLGIGRVVQ
ncbi:protein of unknown function [Bradyrhizobium vignae]|uniref:Uncharacterized protein n=1 Tax=Bradyrhizobium vignae TaxID=1549949 RepID=A0A2U3PPW4_9BRAD|nr:protein of unknown function [Bradyrhizobium vignae]